MKKLNGEKGFCSAVEPVCAQEDPWPRYFEPKFRGPKKESRPLLGKLDPPNGLKVGETADVVCSKERALGPLEIARGIFPPTLLCVK